MLSGRCWILRAHDDRFDAMINKLEFNGKDTGRMEVIAVADKVVKKTKRQTKKSELAGKARKSSGIGSAVSPAPEQFDIEFSVGEIGVPCTRKSLKNTAVTGITGKTGRTISLKLPARISTAFTVFSKIRVIK